jgi:16S rRNA (guanine527-N7)-methyltransferase
MIQGRLAQTNFMKLTSHQGGALEQLSIEAALLSGLSQLGLELEAGQREKILEYIALLNKWGTVYNLTAIKDSKDILVQHVLDCLSVIKPISERVVAGSTILDVGSGAGLPALMIAIARPDLNVVAIDAVAKKVAFIKQAALQLALPNAIAKHGRIEKETGLKYELIVSRAFSSLKDFIKGTQGRLLEGGVWMAMKGKMPEEEIKELPEGVDLIEVTQLKVPMMNAERCLVWMREGQS